MFRKILCLIFVFCFVLPRPAFSNNVINVVVLFSDDVSMSGTDKLLKVAEYQAFANAAMVLSSMGNRSFAFATLLTSVSYNAEQQTSAQAIEWLREKNGDNVHPTTFFFSVIP